MVEWLINKQGTYLRINTSQNDTPFGMQIPPARIVEIVIALEFYAKMFSPRFSYRKTRGFMRSISYMCPRLCVCIFAPSIINF
jgi:hypothetical protein